MGKHRACVQPYFALLGRDKDKILAVELSYGPNNASPAVLYDDRSGCSDEIYPSLDHGLINPFSVAVGDSLYFMDGDFDDDDGSGDDDDSSSDEEYGERFDALVPNCGGKYSWHAVPGPSPDENIDRNPKLRAYAAVGDSSIWVSAERHGTFALDTARGAWSKAGDWKLPFVGRAVHAPDPEHGDLWFGLSASNHLEAWDLRADGGPASRQRWANMPGIADAPLLQSEVAVLGDGRLCVAGLFEVYEPATPGHCSCCYYRTERERDRVVAMLTGVEVVDDGDGGGLRLIEHKSCRTADTTWASATT